MLQVLGIAGPLFREGDDLLPDKTKALVGTAELPTYLETELGWKLRQQQEASLGLAIEKPADFLAGRKRNIDTIFNTNVKSAYERAVNELKGLGLPEETFKALVMKRADNAYQEAMEVEELRHPGYTRALGAQEANRERMENRLTAEANSPGVTNQLSKAERRALKDKAIAKYKAKRKARKAAKSS